MNSDKRRFRMCDRSGDRRGLLIRQARERLTVGSSPTTSPKLDQLP
jgi:hypothetical protein